MQEIYNTVALPFPERQALLHFFAYKFSEFSRRMNSFEVQEDCLPSFRRLLGHFAKNACFSDSTLRLHANAIAVQGIPKPIDKVVSAEDFRDWQHAARRSFHNIY